MSIAALRLGLVLAIGCMGGVEASAQAFQGDAVLKTFAVHINRTPQQPWPGYGIYLGNGLILTASHVHAAASGLFLSMMQGLSKHHAQDRSFEHIA